MLRIGLSEFRKRDIGLEVNLGTLKGRRKAFDLGVFEVCQNVEFLEVMAEQTKEIEAMLRRKYGHVKPVELLMTIPGIGFLSAFTLYAEICDIKRFSNAEKLAHYAGLVPRVRQSGEHSFAGKETGVMLGLSVFLLSLLGLMFGFVRRVIWQRV